MLQLTRISATRARNDFFNLLKKSFLEKQAFIIEKGQIPMAYLMPVYEEELIKTGQRSEVKLLAELEKFRSSMKKTSDSVGLLRKMRRYGK